jgi:hypothetical protein
MGLGEDYKAVLFSFFCCLRQTARVHSTRRKMCRRHRQARDREGPIPRGDVRIKTVSLGSKRPLGGFTPHFPTPPFLFGLPQEGCSLGRVKEPSNKYWPLICLTRAPGAPRAPGKPPKPSVGVSGTSGSLPEAPGTHHEPNQKTYEPKNID